MNSKTALLLWCIVATLFALGGPAGADDALLKPFVLSYQGTADLHAKTAEIKTAVIREGFEVLGEYSPYKGAHIVVVTSDALKAHAAKSNFGAYGAIQRISLTEKGKELQIAYTNPLYLAQAYRMKENLADVASKLEKALGRKDVFGSKNGLKAEKLRSYHYMVMMPYFDDQILLKRHKSHEEALQSVESNLSAGKGGTLKVYRVDLPGKKESVFGVGIREGEGADATVMKTVDFGELKQTAHLPYELIVSEGAVYMLHGKFRIAVDFPDLTMGTFMKISGAPAAIETVLKQVAGGKEK